MRTSLGMLSCALLLTLRAAGATLGYADGYNIFAFDSVNYSNTSIEAKVAGGNSVILTNMQTANLLPGNNTDVAVLSGGTADLSNGSVRGSVQYATTLANGTATLNSGASYVQAPSPFDFAMVKALYQEYSDSVGTVASNSTINATPGNVTYVGTDPDLNVFTALQSDLENVSFTIDVPAGSTVIINVLASGSVSFNYSGFNTLHGLDGTKLLWNLPNATDITVLGVALLGGILAPGALVNLSNGSLTGQIVADSVIGSSNALKYARFESPFIPPTPFSTVPEPSTWLLVGTALVLIAVLRLRRSRR